MDKMFIAYCLMYLIYLTNKRSHFNSSTPHKQPNLPHIMTMTMITIIITITVTTSNRISVFFLPNTCKIQVCMKMYSINFVIIKFIYSNKNNNDNNIWVGGNDNDNNNAFM